MHYIQQEASLLHFRPIFYGSMVALRIETLDPLEQATTQLKGKALEWYLLLCVETFSRTTEHVLGTEGPTSSGVPRHMFISTRLTSTIPHTTGCDTR